MKLEGFMYLDIDNPLVAWNAYRGVLVSQKLVQQSVGNPLVPALSMTVANFFMNRDWERLEFENELEMERERNFPKKVSRLTGLFVFDEPESALAVADDESWGGAKGHIQDDNLTDIEISAAPNYTRLDANWISWMLKVRSEGNLDWRSGILPYWAGDVCPHFSQPIWEGLLDGTVTIWGTELRHRAYASLKKRSPSTVCLLELSRIAASLSSDLGHISALVTRENGQQLMSFHIDMQDSNDKTFLDRLGKYINENPTLVNFNDLAVGGEKMRLPEFVSYSYVFGS
ncbi:hypothetical protein [Pseudomonas sp. JZ134]|uniref:hypothetical protein n=1 Tax=Pseudomonas sp. JZ134 TaxID=2806615 RepID=UPI003DA05AB9